MAKRFKGGMTKIDKIKREGGTRIKYNMGKRRVMRYENCAAGEDLTCKTVDVWYSVL